MKLLPCPFCGASGDDLRATTRGVWCLRCKASGPDGGPCTIPVAIKDWNHRAGRPDDARAEAELERIKENK